MQESPAPCVAEAPWRHREIRAVETGAAVALRNTSFAPITVAAWGSFAGLTAIVARAPQGVLGGVLPLMTRLLVVAPGRTLATAWEHSVCARGDVRGQGIGSGMVAEARRVMRGRVDALCLYRGDETSAGYRFYVRNGHHDLLHVRRWRREVPAVATVDGFTVESDHAAIIGAESDLSRVFAQAHQEHGGYIAKTRGWLAASVGSFYHTAHPQEFRLVRVERAGILVGYAIVARALLASDASHARVLEIAAPANDRATWDRLLTGVAVVAASWGQPLECAASDESPAAPQLERCGYVPDRRSLIVMGTVLDHTDFARRQVNFAAWLAEVRVEALTPTGDHVLHEPMNAIRTIRLECAVATLTRLLLSRVDFTAALRDGRITTSCRDEGLLAALAATFPRTPWCYHAFDYL